MLTAPAFILGIVLAEPLVALDSLLTGPGSALVDLAYLSMVLSLFVYWPLIALLHYRVVWSLSGSAYVGLVLLVLMPSPWFVYVAASAYSA